MIPRNRRLEVFRDQYEARPRCGTLDGSCSQWPPGPPAEHRAADDCGIASNSAWHGLACRHGRACACSRCSSFPTPSPGPWCRRSPARPGALWDDMLETYAWAQEWQLGYYKHPPFYSWMRRHLVPDLAAHRLGVLSAVGGQCRHRLRRHLGAGRPVPESRGAAAVGAAADVHAVLQFHGVELQRQHHPAVVVAMDRLCIRAFDRDPLRFWRARDLARSPPPGSCRNTTRSCC